MRKLRCGVIGAGAWTVASHIPNLLRHSDEVELVAVSRRNPELLKRIQARYGFQIASTDYRDVLAAGLDICIVASPARWHHEHALAAMESGADVLVEKPFTIAPADAWDLAETADRLNRHILVAFGANYQPMIREAKRLMTEDGGIGEVEEVAVHMASVTRELLLGHPHPFEVEGFRQDAPEVVAESATSADPSLSGGGYAQAQLSHAIGLALWLTGLRGTELSAMTWRPSPAAVEYHAAATVRFENGAIGSISGGSCHWGAGGNKHQQEVRVIGSAGQLHVDVEREIVWRYRGPDDDVRITLVEGDGIYECSGPIDALVDLALGRSVTNASPGDLGARVVEILDALYRSAETHQFVAVRPATIEV